MHNIVDRSILNRPVETRPDESGVEFDLSGLVQLLLRQKWLIGMVIAASLALGVAYLLFATPKYTAEASVILDSRRVQVVQPTNEMPQSEGLVDAGLVESQVETIRSERIARAVVEQLKLTEDEEFIGSGPGLWRQIKNGVKSLLGLMEPHEPGDSPELLAALDTFDTNLKVRRVGVSFVASIAFTSESARKSAQIANAIANAYIDDKLTFRADTMRKASSWLEDRIRELRAQSTAADRAVEAFKTENNIVDAGGKVLADQQIADLSAQLAIAKSDAAAARAKVDRIDELNKNGMQEAALPEVLRNDVITKLQQQYDDDVRREAEWSSRYGANHQAAVALRNEMAQLKKAMQDELRRIGQVYRSEWEIARGREEALRGQLDKMYQDAAGSRQAQIKLRELEASSATYRSLLDVYMQRYVGAVQQQSSPITEARVISEALPPRDKSWPKTTIVLLGAMFGGAFLGMAAAFAREKLDTVVRTSAQAEKLLGVECLGILPALDLASLPAPHGGGDDANRLFAAADQTSGYVLTAPFSQFTETLRSVKISMASKGPDGCQVVGVISALPGEGKTTVAANLALLIAQTGSRVLLIDADLRTTSLTERLTPNAQGGLLEVLTRRASIGEVAWRDATTTLSFLPAVSRTSIAHTNEVISSVPMAEMLRQARRDFDYVILDLPPLAPIVDVRAAARLIDEFVLVVEWAKTPEGVLSRAVSRAEMVHPKIVGFVLNKVDFSTYRTLEGAGGLYYQTRKWERYGYGPT
ncbi:Wzz/FepE/Etk N-terminal domain-containing protein [Alsobacter sp. SYSU M60028]|uniref:non-specific protein-tyrosine kinase n=1 Tax=Alsobacter ponti TaxID=2962936 RepID=A0ABT1LE31_9HYPH|nr:Wzz/FepE/Etk N-terminal domain-containing protein [Alsobacter ponti]MCP8939760.1 Wzz/FepE/Etk N-terminal domain-containing protein [Alsobacter ponti]